MVADEPVDDYDENEDEDFMPDAQAAEDEVNENISSSSDEGEDGDRHAGKQSKVKESKGAITTKEDELDSGDEVTIKELRKRKKKTKKRKTGNDSGDDSEEHGEGGLIKTRAQHRLQQEEKKEARRLQKGHVTADIASIWASMSSTPIGRLTAKDRINAPSVTVTAADDNRTTTMDDTNVLSREPNLDDGEYITIVQTYEFVGKTVNDEKLVHRDSAEAKLFLSTKDSDKKTLATGQSSLVDAKAGIRRPLKRSSMYEPNPTGEVKGLPAERQRLRTPSRADVLAQQQRLQEEARAAGGKAQRLNTVQKSAVDWASHVDTEGLKAELDEYGKSKQGYMAKMDFLQDVQGRRDDEERVARLQKVS